MTKPWYTRLYEYLAAYSEPPDERAEKVVVRAKTTPGPVKIKQRVLRKRRVTKK